MKIKRLELKAFGPFTERTLDFSSELPGLHVVFGPNEAGKSSSLRGLQALLFGFPMRTNDDFYHRYDQLLVGGCLQGSDGRELSFYRRKKNKNSLFDQQDNLLDPAALAPFLHGMEQDVFASMYGINHETLVKGGQGILDLQGEAGQTLFAAGTGLSSLRAIAAELESEADNLFKPRGSTQAITLALAQYRELQGQIKQFTLSSRDWQVHQMALDEAEKKLGVAHVLRRQLHRQKRQLERLKQALPYLGQRRSWLEKLTELGEVIILPADFGERRRHLEQLGREARIRLDAASGRLRILNEKSLGISCNQNLLDHAAVIEEFHQGLGQYRKGKIDCPQLEGRRIGCRTEAAHLLRQIKPGAALSEIEALRPSLAQRKSIQALCARHEALVQGVRLASRIVQANAKELDNINIDLQKLAPATDFAMLARAVSLVQKVGDLDGSIRVNLQGLENTRQESMAALNRLGLWCGALELVEQLAVPLTETLQLYEEEFRSLADKKAQFAIERVKLDNELALFGQQFREIEFAAEVPSEKELGQFRCRREQGWQLLRRQWLHGEDVASESLDYDRHQPLPEAYEKQVDIADQAADRLYREAERVQKYASLKARAEGVNARLVELNAKEQQVDSLQKEAAGRWRELWTPSEVIPLSPREMLAWLSGFEKLRYQVLESARVSKEIAEQETRRRELRGVLLTELLAIGLQPELSGDELAPLLRYSEGLVQRLQTEEMRRERLENKISDLDIALAAAQGDLVEAEVEYQQWQALWDEAVTPLGIAGPARPAEVLDFLDTLHRCFDKLLEADVFRKRIEGIERDGREFEEAVLALTRDIAPALVALDASQAVAQLQALLGRACQEQAILHQYAEEIKILEKNIFATGMESAGIEEQLVTLRQLACCTTEERLNEAEWRSREYLKIKDKLAEIEVALAGIAEGITLADLEGQAQGLDPDEIMLKIEEATAEIEDKLDPEIRQLSEAIGQEKNELARMDGNGKAAELAEMSQQILAKIRRFSERYICIRLASKVLREEIERYRADNQDPVVKIASRHLQILTLGSLAGLRTDIDDQGQPILVGIRPNGAWLPVAGMSSGTRDQLYLALRLATLEWRIKSSEPMPFIVDDILINFDDQRSQATLKVLADLAEKTQVILFTHNSQIFQASQTLKSVGRVFCHQL